MSTRQSRLHLHTFVGEVHGVARWANVALPVHLARPWFEERCAATEQHRGKVQAQLVDEALFQRLADDVAAAHDHDVTMGRGGPRLVDRGDQIGDEGDAHPQFAFQPDLLRRRVGDDEERRRPRLIGAVPHLLVPTIGAVDDVEQPPPHHHRTALRRRLFEDLGVDRVLLHDPGVELRSIAEPVLLIGTIPRHEPVERHRDVSDHLRHQSLPLTSRWVLATSCGGVERWVLEDAGPVLDQLDAAVEGAVVDHLEGDVRVAVVDAFCSRGAGDHREHHDPEAIDESGSQQRPAQADAADRADEARAVLLHRPDRLDRVIAHERGVGPRERLLERGGEHHLRRSRESVDGRLLVGGELVRSRWRLSGGEARHQPVRVRSHHVRDLGLLAEPGEVLRPLETPEAGPALPRRVAVEGGDEVDEEFWHGRVLVLGCQVAAPAFATTAARGWTGGESRTHRQREQQFHEVGAASRAVGVVAPPLRALLDRPGTDAFEGGEWAALVGDDPHVDHRRLLMLDERRAARAVGSGDALDLGGDGIIGQAEVVVDVPLHQRAAPVGDVLQRDVVREHVHRRDELLAAIWLRLIDQALGRVRVEPDVVVDPVPVHVVLVATVGISDRVEPGRLGDRRVGPLRKADDVDGDLVLSERLLLGRDAVDAGQVDRLGRVVCDGGRIVHRCSIVVGDRRRRARRRASGWSSLHPGRRGPRRGDGLGPRHRCERVWRPTSSRRR